MKKGMDEITLWSESVSSELRGYCGYQTMMPHGGGCPTMVETHTCRREGSPHPIKKGASPSGSTGLPAGSPKLGLEGKAFQREGVD